MGEGRIPHTSKQHTFPCTHTEKEILVISRFVRFNYQAYSSCKQCYIFVHKMRATYILQTQIIYSFKENSCITFVHYAKYVKRNCI